MNSQKHWNADNKQIHEESASLTYRELKAALPSTDGVSVPSEKWLRAHYEAVFCSVKFDGSAITVYDNGFYTYEKDGRMTILRVDGFDNIRYQFQDGASSTVAEAEYANSAFALPLVLNGENQMERNLSMDRASGSGVFARDPDAQLDMIQLELSDDLKNNVRDGQATAWRLESSLREFENIEPLNFWFEYPVHRVDSNGALGEMPAQGTTEAGRMKNKHLKTPETCAEEFRNAFQVLNMGDGVTVQDMMDYLAVTDKTVYARIKKLKGEFVLKKGRISRSGAASGDAK